jgi:hypothetical protein
VKAAAPNVNVLKKTRRLLGTKIWLIETAPLGLKVKEKRG